MLGPCPFCGGTAVFIDRAGVLWHGVCKTCEALGPPRSTPDEAREQWNRRILPDLQTQAANDQPA